MLLLIVVFLSSGQIIHSQLLKIGEATWQEYFMLRSAGVMPEPTCNPDPNTSLMELLIMLDAVRRGSAARVTACLTGCSAVCL